MMQNTRGEWQQIVKRVYARKNFNNYDLGARTVRALGYPEFYGPPGSTTILDGYPGAAVFSAALHNEIRPKTHVLLEPFISYCKFLTTLKSPSVHIQQADPYRWGTFTHLLADGTLHPADLWVDRDRVNNRLLFTSNLTHAQGEQLVAQYLNCISNQSWIMQYGRVRLLLWMRASVAEKLLAGPGEKFRHRIGAQRESCCDARLVFHVPSSNAAVAPQSNGAKYPVALQSPIMEYNPKKDFAAKQATSLSLVELTPYEKQLDHIDEFEYVLKMLFVLSSTPLSKALDSLGPGGAEDLSPHLKDILHLKPTELSIDDFVRITYAFWRWPFKPDQLMDFYEESNLGLGTGEEP